MAVAIRANARNGAALQWTGVIRDAATDDNHASANACAGGKDSDAVAAANPDCAGGGAKSWDSPPVSPKPSIATGFDSDAGSVGSAEGRTQGGNNRTRNTANRSCRPRQAWTGEAKEESTMSGSELFSVTEESREWKDHTTEWLIARRIETCPNCYGHGWTSGGWGHFGDCNGDAGEGWKPCLARCSRCMGTGFIKAK